VAHRLEGLLTGEHPSISVDAARALWRITGKTEKALPVLVRGLEEGCTYAESAVRTLAGMGAAAVPALEDALHSGDRKLRVNAAKALGMMGPLAAPAVPALEGTVRTEFSSIQLAAVKALGEVGPRAGHAVPALRKLLRGRDANLRVATAFALWQITGESRKTVPLLARALYIDRFGVVRDSSAALARMGPAARSALRDIETFRRCCAPMSYDLWQAAAIAEFRAAGRDPRMVRALCRVLHAEHFESGDDPRWATEAARELGNLGAQARAAIPVLEAVRYRPYADARLRAAATEALEKIRKASGGGQ
jgi:hypothetical protein